MTLQYWTSASMGVSSSSGEYEYFGVSADMYATIKRMLRQGREGECWQVLRGYRRVVCES